VEMNYEWMKNGYFRPVSRGFWVILKGVDIDFG